MTCAHCEELQERIIWLEGELGLQRDAEVFDRLSRAMRSVAHLGRPQVAQMVSALYAAKGRPVSDWQLLEAVPPQGGGEDERNPGIVKVWVHRARISLGREAIESVRARGYRLTPAGMTAVESIIHPERVAA